ncbi:MAG TPA: S-layer homology domain-containing protein, partial [Firmicutes bacterium]|nr:S-layer homology domain-containing protein [Bacillota bacterium]
MSRTKGWPVMFLTALFAVLLAGGSTVCLAAEGAFSDAPAADHWASGAVEELGRQGILIGYPDGTFRGDRAATRYELAMALSRLFALVKETAE